MTLIIGMTTNWSIDIDGYLLYTYEFDIFIIDACMYSSTFNLRFNDNEILKNKKN